MIHEPELLEKLSSYKSERFDGRVFRVTRASADPTAPSTSGGRWSPIDVSALYTSLEHDGALAEVVSYLSEQIPLPSKPLRIHQIETATTRTLRLIRADLADLGVDMARFGERDYSITQRIGAALCFLEADGLIAPSARWTCDNLTVFSENHAIDEMLQVVSSEDVDWQAWGRENGFL